MKEKQIDEFEKCYFQTESMRAEFANLAKKDQDGVVNAFKIKFVNKLLQTLNGVLGKDYEPFDDFKQFEDSSLPTNSDVTMILGQYLKCLQKMYEDNIVEEDMGTDWYWLIDGKESKLLAKLPRRLKERPQ